MQILKLEQNLFQELDPKQQPSVREWKEGDSVYRQAAVDCFDGISSVTMEKRKYPYFYKYYLYLDGQMEKEISLRSEEGARFLIAFYKKFCPDYVKTEEYDPEKGMQPDVYFYMEKIPGESMQHFIPGKGLAEEFEEEAKPDTPAYSGSLDGYHEFSEEEKQDIGGQLDVLKSQFADQLKDLEALLGKKV